MYFLSFILNIRTIRSNYFFKIRELSSDKLAARACFILVRANRMRTCAVPPSECRYHFSPDRIPRLVEANSNDGQTANIFVFRSEYDREWNAYRY